MDQRQKETETKAIDSFDGAVALYSKSSSYEITHEALIRQINEIGRIRVPEADFDTLLRMRGITPQASSFSGLRNMIDHRVSQLGREMLETADLKQAMDLRACAPGDSEFEALAHVKVAELQRKALETTTFLETLEIINQVLTSSEIRALALIRINHLGPEYLHTHDNLSAERLMEIDDLAFKESDFKFIIRDRIGKLRYSGMQRQSAR